MKKKLQLTILFIAAILTVLQIGHASSQKNEATVVSDSKTFYLVDAENNRIDNFEIQMMGEESFTITLTIKRKGK